MKHAKNKKIKKIQKKLNALQIFFTKPFTNLVYFVYMSHSFVKSINSTKYKKKYKELINIHRNIIYSLHGY